MIDDQNGRNDFDDKNLSFTPGGIPMKLSLPRAFCCVLYAVCWLDTTSTFRQKSNNENDCESEEQEESKQEKGGEEEEEE